MSRILKNQCPVSERQRRGCACERLCNRCMILPGGPGHRKGQSREQARHRRGGGGTTGLHSFRQGHADRYTRHRLHLQAQHHGQLDFLQRCDAALFLVSADPLITKVALGFLRQVKQKVPRLFFVRNKVNHLDAREREEALDFYQRVLAGKVGRDGKTPVFCVSARMGLAAKTAAESSGRIASGMEVLEYYLVGYLAREKFSALPDAVSRRSFEFMIAVQTELGIDLPTLRLQQQEFEVKNRIL